MTDNARPSHDSRRDSIIEAASRVFAEKGFRRTSNREIAREADISSGLIYWYFRNKTELFQAVVERLFPLSGFEIPREQAAELDLETLLGMIGHQFMQIVTGPNVLRLMRLALSEIIEFPDVWRRVGQMISERAIGPLAAQLDLRIARDEIPPVDTRMAAQAFFGSLVGYVLRKYLYQSVDLQDSDDQEFVSVVVGIHARGLSRGETPST